jgi:23S rRNA (uridine2552-2'-O)-methyltransferase
MAQSKSSKAWLHEHVTDPYVHLAKKEGWRSRAAFKLMEIDEKDHLLKPGATVVDLGAAPGGWSQLAARKVGGKGKVLAIDLLEMQGIGGVEFLQGDFTDEAVLHQFEAMLGDRPVDLVLSDMAPNLSGIATMDQARVMALAELALDFACEHLTPGGAFLVKVFQGRDYPAYLAEMRKRFKTVATRKPKASRDRSAELYLLGTC